MEITIAGQTWMFLMAIALGAALGACYDVFRVIRIAVVHPPVIVMVQDIIYCFVCAVATFLYMISVDCGQIRMFVLIGEIIGWVLYYFTLGTLVIGISKHIIQGVKYILGLLYKIFCAPIFSILKKIKGILLKLVKNLGKYLKKKAKISKNHLKKPYSLLYNLKKRHKTGVMTEENNNIRNA
ncbi:spore cortex biosynthesis protein YabQ [Youxingia wuxianensis]|nr:spore cortex biosynthesis protein YabQ [Youxingia wuxianensis]